MRRSANPNRPSVASKTGLRTTMAKRRRFLPESPVNFFLARLSVNPVPAAEEFLSTGRISHLTNRRRSRRTYSTFHSEKKTSIFRALLRLGCSRGTFCRLRFLARDSLPRYSYGPSVGEGHRGKALQQVIHTMMVAASHPRERVKPCPIRSQGKLSILSSRRSDILSSTVPKIRI